MSFKVYELRHVTYTRKRDRATETLKTSTFVDIISERLTIERVK